MRRSYKKELPSKEVKKRAKKDFEEITCAGYVFGLSEEEAEAEDEHGHEHAKESVAKRESLEYLRARAQQLERENQRLLLALGQQQEIAHAIAHSIQAFPPYPPYKYQRPRRGKTPVVGVLCLSDWHIGEVVSPKETEGFGEFNFEIAQKRMFEILEGFFRWVDVQRSAYPIDKFVFLGLGDYISGMIHAELLMNQEMTPIQQAVCAGELLGEVLHRAASHAKEIEFVGVGADNHGRLFQKPVAKKKYQTNFSFISHAIAKQLSSRIKNLKFIEAEGMKHVADINGFKFLCEHGDQVRSWMGIPWYGLERMRGREAMRRMHHADKVFHYIVIGHYHVPGWVSGNILCNGSLTGTNEYDHSCGRHAQASQLAFLVHGEHGVFNLLAFQPR